MLKTASLVCAAMLLLFAAKPQSDQFSKYKTVEAYEVRPGILMMPRYSEDGQVCEIGLERRHYSPEHITPYSTLSSEDVDQIIAELVPFKERGSKDEKWGDMSTQDGPSITTFTEYANVSIQVYGAVLPSSEKKKDDVAAVIKWKNRKCK